MKLKKKTISIVQELDELQNLLYAECKHAILIVMQGMDAAGKDGLIRDVFGQMNPQGVKVCSFKVPTQEEAAHDFSGASISRYLKKGPFRYLTVRIMKTSW